MPWGPGRAFQAVPAVTVLPAAMGELGARVATAANQSSATPAPMAMAVQAALVGALAMLEMVERALAALVRTSMEPAAAPAANVVRLEAVALVVWRALAAPGVTRVLLAEAVRPRAVAATVDAVAMATAGPIPVAD